MLVPGKSPGAQCMGPLWLVKSMYSATTLSTIPGCAASYSAPQMPSQPFSLPMPLPSSQGNWQYADSVAPECRR